MKTRTEILAIILLAAWPTAAQTSVEKAWAVLTLAVGDKGADTRARAIQSLGLITGDSKAAVLAENALRDADEDVRAAAATALGQMGAGGSAPKLREAVKDQSAAVVFAAANALYVLGDPAAFEVYYAVLAGEKKSGDTLLEAQSKMIHDPKALAKIGFEQGIGFVPFGGASYAAFKMMTKDDVSPVRSAAASKLSKDPDPKSQRLLESAVSDKKWLVRAAAIDALAKRGDPSSITAVVPALDDGNEVVRFTACAAVIRLVAAGSK